MKQYRAILFWHFVKLLLVFLFSFFRMLFLLLLVKENQKHTLKKSITLHKHKYKWVEGEVEKVIIQRAGRGKIRKIRKQWRWKNTTPTGGTSFCLERFLFFLNTGSSMWSTCAPWVEMFNTLDQDGDIKDVPSGKATFISQISLHL